MKRNILTLDQFLNENYPQTTRPRKWVSSKSDDYEDEPQSRSERQRPERLKPDIVKDFAQGKLAADVEDFPVDSDVSIEDFKGTARLKNLPGKKNNVNNFNPQNKGRLGQSDLQEILTKLNKITKYGVEWIDGAFHIDILFDSREFNIPDYSVELNTDDGKFSVICGGRSFYSPTPEDLYIDLKTIERDNLQNTILDHNQSEYNFVGKDTIEKYASEQISIFEDDTKHGLEWVYDDEYFGDDTHPEDLFVQIYFDDLDAEFGGAHEHVEIKWFFNAESGDPNTFEIVLNRGLNDPTGEDVFADWSSVMEWLIDAAI